MSNATKQLAKLATEYSAGIRAYYAAKGFPDGYSEVAVVYATQNWLTEVRGWSIEEVADDLEFWREKWAKWAAA